MCHPSSTTRLFADNSVLYRGIRSLDDAIELQKNLEKQEWERDWLMEFHPQKCQDVHVSNKRNPIKKDYIVHGVTLQETDEVKYLGISLHKSLSWNNHIDQVAKKASSTRAFLQRNIYQCPRQTKELCYKTLVLPITEYASVNWDPFTINNIRKLEMVQCRSAPLSWEITGQQVASQKC